MTSRRYPKSKKLSRPRTAPRPLRIPDHYAAAEPERPSDVNPVDLLIDALPGMASLQQEVVRLRRAIQRQVPAPCQADLVRYEDTRTALAFRRAHGYFNLGYERGHFAGMAVSNACTGAVDPAVSAFQRQIYSAISSTKLPSYKMATALLDIARAAVLASHPRGRRAPRTRPPGVNNIHSRQACT